MDRKIASGYRLIFGYLGIFIAFVGIITMIPLLTLAFYPGEADCWWDFALPGGIAVIVGLTLFLSLLAGKDRANFAKHQDSFMLVLIWLCAVTIGAFPFFIAGLRGTMEMTFTESFFEATSGYSTTGLTVLKDFIDSSNSYCPHIFTMYRAITNFFGGIGLVLVVASAISDRYGMKLYYAEGHNDKLLPNLYKSARVILLIYVGYIAAGTFALWLSGMDVFDAMTQSMAALATGGFSPRLNGFAYYLSASFTGNGVLPANTVAIEIVTEILMLLGGTNFVLHTFLIRFKFKKFFSDCEVRFSALVLVVFTTLATLGIMSQFSSSDGTIPDFWLALRYAAFNTVSSYTTTGFTTVSNVASLGTAAVAVSILAMLIGGGVGSTAGGIKQYRVVVTLKSLWWSMKYHLSSNRLLHPHSVWRLGQRHEIAPEEVIDASSFLVLNVVVVALGTILVCLLPAISIGDSLYMVTSGLSLTGSSIIDFGAYAAAHASSYSILLWILSTLMFLGRLEILPVYYFLVRSFGDIFHLEIK